MTEVSKERPQYPVEFIINYLRENNPEKNMLYWKSLEAQYSSKMNWKGHDAKYREIKNDHF